MTDSSPFPAVDRLLDKARASRAPLPAPEERKRLRTQGDLTQAEAAEAVDGVSRELFGRWESGAAEPRGRQREAYRYLLVGLAEIYGTEGDASWLNPLPNGATAATDEPTGKGE
ncbi:helix-turn-helix domain-containing protein [Kitasatospora sp. NPDC048296]|uniref:helix-turn-helix domain-containing protein n=1 Tax=Kitasatospora sp. NPDC048296 TaxID=3364048 RepID=UPI003720C6EA